MSTSQLYHNQDLKGVKYLRTSYAGGKTTYHGVISDSYIKCSKCHSHNTVRSGGVFRTLKLLPTGGRHNLLHLFIPRVVCKKCGTIRQVNVPFLEGQRSYTRALARYVLCLCQFIPLKYVAEFCGLSWDTVKQIHKEGLRRKFKRIKLKDVRQIAIDEVCIGRPRKFLTIVLDLDTGQVLHIGRGKGADALKGFWRRLSHSKATIEAVCTDMASGYMSAVEQHLPEALLIIDHFHLVKYMNDKLTLLRRQLAREADEEGKKLLKGMRWLLVTGRKKLEDEKNPREADMAALDEALKENTPLYIAYYLKEELASLWSKQSKIEAESFLDSWLTKAEGSRVDILEKVAKWLIRVKSNILNWFDYQISSGKLEAFNGKIRRLLKNTCGLRDQEYMFLRIQNLMYAKT
ncbi:MAG: ISL3 family transposase [Candidatus Aegiribacteria sp.]|nr:ISL3 family transposase [Candidatus Aegiribacteria sp.]